MKIILTLLFSVLVLSASAQNNKYMTVNKDAINKLEAFKKKSKFGKEKPPSMYIGLGSPALQSPLSALLNQSADDFKKTFQNNPTEDKFRKDIEIGLSRFNKYYLALDTEDRERVCTYYEELMDCVGLESSNGILNKWMYGFDPNEKK